jgi:membrane protease YdiL (CAAX protease family)
MAALKGLGGRLRIAIAGRPIASYLVIAYGITAALTTLLSVSLVFGLFALFGPAVAAFIVTRAEGRAERQELRERVTAWRRPLSDYAIAFGLPFAVAAGALAIHLAGGGAWLGLGAISAIEIVIFVLVIGEEIGWRGFLQPRLRARHGRATAGVLTGLAWTGWHLPMYVGSGLGTFLVFGWWVVPMAVVIGAVSERARYSVIVATVMHGAANIAAPILLPGIDRTWTLIVTGAIYLALAAAIAVRDARTVRVASTTAAASAS